jgi:hypothetical protein
MRKILLLVLAGALAACTSYESARTTHNVREYLTEDIEEQIVFNLIRAANGLPFAHYDVTTAQSVVTAKATASAGGTKSTVSNDYQPLAVVTSAVRAVTKTLTGSAGGERTNGVTVSVKPIFDDPKLYAKYIKFLNLTPKTWTKETAAQFNEFDTNEPDETAATAKTSAQSPTPLEIVAEVTKQTVETDKDGQPTARKNETLTESRPTRPSPERFPTVRFDQIQSLQASDRKPLKTAYIPRTLRWWGERWYYIPVEYRQEFSNFCLSLIARAGDAGTTGPSGAARIEERQTKAFEDFNSELMRQNTLIQGR